MSTDLTIKSVEAHRILLIIAAAQVDALLGRNAGLATVYLKRSVHFTFPRQHLRGGTL